MSNKIPAPVPFPSEHPAGGCSEKDVEAYTDEVVAQMDEARGARRGAKWLRIKPTRMQVSLATRIEVAQRFVQQGWTVASDACDSTLYFWLPSVEAPAPIAGYEPPGFGRLIEGA